MRAVSTEWKDVVGFEGIYKVNNRGVIRSCARVVNYSDGRTREYPEGFKQTSFDAQGYELVKFWRNNEEFSRLVHRVVAEAFLPDFTPDCVVNHVDYNRANNHVRNLECITQKENIAHSMRNYRNSDGTHKNSKVTAESVRRIRDDFSNGATATSLALEHGVCTASVYNILAGKTHEVVK